MNEAFIDTLSGNKFFFLNPEKSAVILDDIAHSLSLQCRYTGHSRGFYSVGEHSVIMALYAEKQRHTAQECLQCLMHDAPEAYIADVAKPLKNLLPDYMEIEKKVEADIMRRFNLQFPQPAFVKEYDMRILLDEKAVLLPASSSDWGITAPPLGVRIYMWDPKTAKKMFLQHFERFCAQISEKKNG